MWREIFQRETYIGKMRVNRKLRILHEGVTCLDAKVIDLRPTTRRFVHFTMHPEYVRSSNSYFYRYGLPMEFDIQFLPLIFLFSKLKAFYKDLINSKMFSECNYALFRIEYHVICTHTYLQTIF